MFLFFFFNDTATTEIYTLSLHDALPILGTRKKTLQSVIRSCSIRDTMAAISPMLRRLKVVLIWTGRPASLADRKSTRLNSSHPSISYAVFCLKKKKKKKKKNIRVYNSV